MPSRSWRHALLYFTIALVFALPAVSQSDATPSLGDVARATRDAHKNASAKPSKVFDEADIQAMKGPIPDASFDGTDNSEQIIQAMLAYADKHSPVETEATFRSWYDTEMAMVRKLFVQNIIITQDRVSPSSANALDQYNPYENYQTTRSNTEQRDLSDLKTMGENQTTVARVMACLTKVKDGLKLKRRLEYDWFNTDYPKTTLVPLAPRPRQPGYSY